MKKKILSIEGLPQADWALIDFGDIVLHIFKPGIRELYDLEKINIKTFSYLDVGLGFGKKLKWSIGGQYTMVDTSNYKNDFLNYTNLNYLKGYP